MPKIQLKSPPTTRASVEYWKQNRAKLGTLRQAYCNSAHGIGHLVVEGSEAMMTLRGCTCGYAGEGPHGTAEVLQSLGVDEAQAYELMKEQVFKVLFECRE